jgi:hypothetical protein
MCCDRPFVIHDVVDTCSLYVMVPKEHIYVRSHQWEHEYLKSQVQELIYIFRRLGASSLRITVSQNQDSYESYGGSVKAHIQELGMGAGLSLVHEKDTTNMDSISTSIVFEPQEKSRRHDVAALATIEDLLADPQIHYLSNRPAWQNFVNNRLQGQATMIHFTFTHHNVIYMSKRLMLSCSRAGITVHDTSQNLLWVKMVFNATWMGDITAPVGRRSPITPIRGDITASVGQRSSLDCFALSPITPIIGDSVQDTKHGDQDKQGLRFVTAKNVSSKV